MSGGGQSAAPMATQVPSQAEPALVLEQASKRFGRVAAVSALDLTLGDGEVLALVGPSGCGKSTALRLVAGLERPDAGEIRIAGATVAGRSRWQSAEQRRVSICFQDHALFPHLTVAGNVGFGLAGWPSARRRARVEEALEMVDLQTLARRYPHELSGGEQQRVALARALAPQPALLLLDEPFSNLDRHLREQVRGETFSVLRRTGTAALFVTHDPLEALAAGDRVAVMRGGRLAQVGPPEQVFHAPTDRFVATFLGDADFLPAQTSGSRLLTEAGAVPAPPGLPDRHDLEVMVRPHEVTLRAGEDGTARVVDSQFQGGFVLHTVALDSGRTLRSLQPHTAGFPVGTRLHPHLEPGHPPAVFAGEQAAGDGGL